MSINSTPARLLTAVNSITTTEHMHPSQKFAINALKTALLKKYNDDGQPTEKQKAAALAKWQQVRMHLRQLDVEALVKTELFAKVKRRLASFLHLGTICGVTYTIPHNYKEAFDIGPRASVGVSSYDVYGKLFNSPFTCTDLSLHKLWTSSLHTSHYQAEALRSTRLGEVVCNSRLSFVPKTCDVARVICTEPVGNMLAQKAVAAYLKSCLKENLGIDLSTQQSVNRRMARLGSIDGSYATIDLESASDTISLELCKQLLPRGLLSACLWCRSPYVDVPGIDEPQEMEMISTMGNDFTFPLQTIIFSAICVSVHEMREGRLTNPRSRVFVNGDDMVVKTGDYDAIISALRMFGFIPNREKSFADGPFRESCGGDYYLGIDVRGIYIKNLNNDSEIVHAFNAVRYWGWRHGTNVFRVLLALRRLMRSTPTYVPLDTPFNEGIVCELGQALRFSKGGVSRLADDHDHSFGCPTWSYKRYVAVRRRHRLEQDSQCNTDGLLIAVSSGRIPSYNGHPLLSLPMRGSRASETRLRKRFTSTTVWPLYRDWKDVAAWG